jgi:6-phosphogluconolactonase (cycloisomerase 2 family)
LKNPVIVIILLISICFITPDLSHSFELSFKGKIQNGDGGLDGLERPYSLALSPDNKNVYITTADDNALTWFIRDTISGDLTYQGSVGGINTPVYVTVSADNRHVYVASLGDDAVTWYSRDGLTGEPAYIGSIQDGSGGADGLQDPYSIAFSPEGDYAYIAGNGDDGVAWCARDTLTGSLSYAGIIKDSDAGVINLRGPRSLAVSLDGKNVYVAAYSSHAITWLSRDTLTGALAYQGDIWASDVYGTEQAYYVALSPDDRHVYLASVFCNSVSTYIRDQSTGDLTYEDIVIDDTGSVRGLDGVRSLALSPDGQFLYASGFYDNSVAYFSRDDSTGRIFYRGRAVDGSGSVDGLYGAYSVGVSPDGRHVYVTAVREDAVTWFSRNVGTGGLSYVNVIKEGDGGLKGLNRVKSLVFGPAGNQLYAASMSDDAVAWFDFDSSAGRLAFQGLAQDNISGVDGLDGSVSMVISPDSQFAYAASYVDDALCWFSVEGNTGDLTYLGLLKDGVDNVDGLNGVKCISMSPDGRFVYATGFGDKTAAWFARDVSTGALTFGGLLKDDSSGVDGLNGADVIDLSPDGRHAYIYGATDASVSWFSRDSTTGELSFQGILKDSVENIEGRFRPNNLRVGPGGDQVYILLFILDAVAWFSRDPASGALTYAGMVQDSVGGVAGLDEPLQDWMSRGLLPSALTGSARLLLHQEPMRFHGIPGTP